MYVPALVPNVVGEEVRRDLPNEALDILGKAQWPDARPEQELLGIRASWHVDSGLDVSPQHKEPGVPDYPGDVAATS